MCWIPFYTCGMSWLYCDNRRPYSIYTNSRRYVGVDLSADLRFTWRWPRRILSFAMWHHRSHIIYQHFGSMCSLRLQSRHSFTLNTEAASFSETSLSFCQITRRHIPEDGILHRALLALRLAVWCIPHPRYSNGILYKVWLVCLEIIFLSSWRVV